MLEVLRYPSLMLLSASLAWKIKETTIRSITLIEVLTPMPAFALIFRPSYTGLVVEMAEVCWKDRWDWEAVGDEVGDVRELITEAQMLGCRRIC
jgi:hypothetical protein